MNRTAWRPHCRTGGIQRLHQTWLGYTETQGSPKLQKTIAQTYQTIGIEELLVHAGAKEAIFISFMKIALQAEDHIFINARIIS
ncbi:hypothetical protein Lepto7375DRAFT_2511 [Leptolyngbya sp. PCC 7375]|nr:hypothetical protein Lepto7375DRAFT_2511 [Leptolyngbya sp. PCC 7375]